MKQLKGFDFENLARAVEFFEEKGYTFVSGVLWYECLFAAFCGFE